MRTAVAVLVLLALAAAVSAEGVARDRVVSKGNKDFTKSAHYPEKTGARRLLGGKGIFLFPKLTISKGAPMMGMMNSTSNSTSNSTVIGKSIVISISPKGKGSAGAMG